MRSSPTNLQHTSAYVSIRQHTSAYVSIRQHTSAYVSMRQHASAYVSIRQHTYPTTSAYVPDYEAAARLFDYVLVSLPGREHADAYVLKQLRVRMPVGVRRVEGGGSVDAEGVYA